MLHPSGTQKIWRRPPYLLLQPTPTLITSLSGEQYQISSSLLSKFVRGVRWMDGWMQHARLTLLLLLPHSPLFKPLISPSSHFLVSLSQPASQPPLEGLTADTLGNKYRLRAPKFSCHPFIRGSSTFGEILNIGFLKQHP